ncbi:alpha/beta hydrolase [Parvularcula sp. IMCC14364]|uniref:alpha/beta hydrolase n=1 Tax=Parvularcula sp. IMCC14364 TaxID=3067902 RepID=UPI002741D639|nr:hypothetical protein [Parvularcula sp. IMCC14364]
MTRIFKNAVSVALLLAVSLTLAACSQQQAEPQTQVEAVSKASPELSVTSADGIIVHGTKSFAGLGPDTPLIHLFHQGGSNGRAEYGPIVPWLNEAGFRTIVWDQRKGGDIHGGENRTAAALNQDEVSFCDAYPDLEAAVLNTTDLSEGAPVIIWGSSYSAALVFQIAAENAGAVDGVLSFSPASGGPMVDCRARDYVDAIDVPVFVLRPASEMERESAVEQRDILVASDVSFEVIENGVHGSSMLVDERTGADMASARALILAWLNGIANK